MQFLNRGIVNRTFENRTLCEFDFRTNRTQSNKSNQYYYYHYYHTELNPLDCVRWVNSFEQRLLCGLENTVKNTSNTNVTRASKNLSLIFNTSFTKSQELGNQKFDLVRLYNQFSVSSHWFDCQTQSIHRAVHLLLWSSFPSSLPIFFTATNSKDRSAVDRKNSAKCGATFSNEH